VKELQKKEGPGILIALAGNKADLNDLRAVEADVIIIHFPCVASNNNVMFYRNF